VAEAIIVGQDLPLVVTVRNSGERAGRKVVQGYLEGPDDNPSSPLRALAGFSIIDAGPGEQAKARLTVPARFDEGLSQWVWNPGISRLHAGRSSRNLRVNIQVVLRCDRGERPAWRNGRMNRRGGRIAAADHSRLQTRR